MSLAEVVNDPDYTGSKKQYPIKVKATDHEEDLTPQDRIDSGINAIKDQVKRELLDRLKTMDPYIFQNVILELLKKMGYGSPQQTARGADGGIDGIINQDALGLDKIYIQAKRYKDNKIHELEIRNFIGAIGRDTHKAVFVTTSAFDEKALRKAQDASQKIITIDGQRLVDLMYEHGVGVQVKTTYEVKGLDEDFFEEE